jgi:alkanesulfonate monooxygenase
MAARMFATLDNLSNGRAGIHIITGGLDAELASDGDFLTKDQRYLRSAEFVQILRGIWTNTRPFDYEGQFYRFTQALSELRPSEPTGIPIYWGGNSPIARRLAAENCDIYSFSLTKLAEAKAVIDEVRALVPLGVRTPAFHGNLRIILGRTEQLAWRNARELASLLADQAEARRRETGSGRDHRSSLGRPELKGKSDNEPGTQERYADAIDLPPVDTCLWFGTFQASGGSNPPSLVGTPDTVAKAILAYYKLGIKSLMMRGFNQLPDAVEHGLELIPRIRELVAEHDGAT